MRAIYVNHSDFARNNAGILQKKLLYAKKNLPNLIRCPVLNQRFKNFLKTASGHCMILIQFV